MRVTAYGEQPLNEPGGLIAAILYGSEPARTAEVAIVQRPQRHPVLGAMAYGSRQLTLNVWRDGRPFGDIDPPTEDLVAAVFAPERGPRVLTAERVDGDPTTTVTSLAAVTSLRRVDNLRWEVTLELPEPFVAITAVGGSPTTIGGTLPAAPVLTLAAGQPVTRWRVAVTDRTGRGLAGEPLRIPLALDATHTRVYQAGRDVPFRCAGGGLWVRVDVRQDTATTLDVYSGPGIVNGTTADRLLLGQLNPETSTNAVWRFDGIGQQAGVATIQGAGVWQRAITHAPRTGVSYGYGIVRDSYTELIVGMQGGIPDKVYRTDATRIDTPGQGANTVTTFVFREQYIERLNLLNDADGVVLLSGVEITAVSGITADWQITAFRTSSEVVMSESIIPSVDYTSTNAANPIDYIEVIGEFQRRLPGAYDWEPVDLASIAGAVEIAVGARPGNTPYIGNTVTITGRPVVERDAARLPTITIADPVPALLVGGTIRNATTGTGITVTDLLVDADGLTIDAAAQQITASGPWYARSLTFEQAGAWLTLLPGTNAVTNTVGATWTVVERWGV